MMSENEKPAVKMEVSKPAKKAKQKKKDQGAASKVAVWFKEVKAEALKIIWPSKSELLKMTFTVVVTSLLFGTLITGMDVVFRFVVEFLNSVV